MTPNPCAFCNGGEGPFDVAAASDHLISAVKASVSAGHDRPGTAENLWLALVEVNGCDFSSKKAAAGLVDAIERHVLPNLLQGGYRRVAYGLRDTIDAARGSFANVAV